MVSPSFNFRAEAPDCDATTVTEGYATAARFPRCLP